MTKDHVMHLMYRCKFAGRKCLPQMLGEISTDKGRCYAFNNDPTHQLISRASG